MLGVGKSKIEIQKKQHVGEWIRNSVTLHQPNLHAYDGHEEQNKFPTTIVSIVYSRSQVFDEGSLPWLRIERPPVTEEKLTNFFISKGN